mmetsp:Transcript_18134/g.50390  ORF Transcript_18134/g.50390 Transcript_18134/m.50390 type:complete len:310 (+) Transcript_18134:62-991(+)
MPDRRPRSRRHHHRVLEGGLGRGAPRMVAISGSATPGLGVHQLPDLRSSPVEGGGAAEQIVLPHPSKALVELFEAFPVAQVVSPEAHRASIVLAEALPVLQMKAAGDAGEVGLLRRLATWENVLFDEALPDHDLPNRAAYRLDQHDAVLDQKVVALAEEFRQMLPTHMLDHLDGDDSVEGLRLQGAVVLQEKLDVRMRIPLPGELELLLGQREARDLDAVLGGQEVGHGAPTEADLEHAEPRSEVQLLCYHLHLGSLRCIQIHAWFAEVGARVHHRGPQHLFVEPVRDVVMEADVDRCRLERVSGNQPG